jgi:hypothetical protein
MIFTLNTKSINDAWFQLLYNILDTDENGNFKHSYPTGIIQHGSFAHEQSRLQYKSVAFSIEYPLIDRMVMIPEGSNVPSPISEKKGIEYFHDYIIGDKLQENETYTYGSRINISLPYVMDMLKNTPITNQAVIEIAKPDDVYTCIGNDGKLDPPCLRIIGFKVIPFYENGILNRSKSKLDMHITFRSWDLYGGMPLNCFGLSMLQEMLSEYIEIPVGMMYCYSEGLHLYKYQKELAEMRTNMLGGQY